MGSTAALPSRRLYDAPRAGSPTRQESAPFSWRAVDLTLVARLLANMARVLVAYAVILGVVLYTCVWTCAGFLVGILACFGSRILFAHLVGSSPFDRLIMHLLLSAAHGLHRISLCFLVLRALDRRASRHLWSGDLLLQYCAHKPQATPSQSARTCFFSQITYILRNVELL